MCVCVCRIYERAEMNSPIFVSGDPVRAREPRQIHLYIYIYIYIYRYIYMCVCVYRI